MTTLFGLFSAVAVSIVLLLYGYADAPFLSKLSARQKKFVWAAAIAVAIAVMGYDVWGNYVEPAFELRAKRDAIILGERDSESWPGHKYGERFSLSDPISPPLRMSPGEKRRFNPQVYVQTSGEAVQDSIVFLTFPKDLSIEVPTPWTITDSPDSNTLRYSAKFGTIPTGVMSSPSEAAFFVDSNAVGRFNISYVITGITQTKDLLPINRSFTVVVAPSNPQPLAVADPETASLPKVGDWVRLKNTKRIYEVRLCDSFSLWLHGHPSAWPITHVVELRKSAPSVCDPSGSAPEDAAEMESILKGDSR